MNPSGCLLDTGPLVALLAQEDQEHERGKNLFSFYKPPFHTCEAVITEACFLLGRFDRSGPQKVLLLGEKGFYQISFQLRNHWIETETLLKKYGDQPISLADACLIRLAELHSEPRILTFDSDFGIYRWGRNKKFELLT